VSARYRNSRHRKERRCVPTTEKGYEHAKLMDLVREGGKSWLVYSKKMELNFKTGETMYFVKLRLIEES